MVQIHTKLMGYVPFYGTYKQVSGNHKNRANLKQTNRNLTTSLLKTEI